jgi:D-alanyl-D-alanine carboxypeptidase
MDGLTYRPNYIVTPTRKRFKPTRPILFLLALSIFFIQTSAGLSAQAFENQSVNQPGFDELNSYLSIAEDAPEPLVYAQGYLLLDPTNAEVVIGKNIDAAVPIASTTKMVTALVARQEFQLDEIVTVGSFAANIIGSKVGLVAGEKITVENLLKALLIQSGNDAAFALAEYYSGQPKDYQSFVVKMNDYVRSVGLPVSVFGDPAGLDDEKGRSTAWELSQIARLVINDPILSEIVKISKTTVYSIDGLHSHQLANSNRLIIPDSPHYLPGAIGIKTGFTHDAGHCLVSAYQTEVGLLIGVVLNTVEYTSSASSAESKKLYQWADRYLERRQY